jgi:hypothetical protein
MTVDGATLRLATAASEVLLPLPAADFAYQVELVQPSGSVEALGVSARLRPDAATSPQVPADDPATSPPTTVPSIPVSMAAGMPLSAS